ncbi:hypothetical protein E1B28_012975 [Marasmius oreades]|uniref:tyrosinase n=1 Tax=Marasmius oreades TaxID=181124 RepID=A0A9P7RNZ5_9AGAR|nr:uncharacterized protein E1B28_012975 [Marasmius oreades]KAG7086997.1 hypothetical protein E1B28_012975 [Marasmius oreades]
MPDFPVPIVGREGTGTHPRLSIDDLQVNKPFQFALFIMSYLIIQEREPEAQPGQGSASEFEAIFKAYYEVLSKPPESAALIFSTVAGIHGLPYQAWSGDPDHVKKADYDKTDPKDIGPMPSRFGGYCNHGSVLFPSWHRPYVLAIEQSIGLIAEALAKILEDSKVFPQGIWTQAANELRFPWWDWAKNAKDGLPVVLTDDRVSLVLKGTTVTATCSNPLSYFPFKSIPDGFQDITDPESKVTAYFAKWKRTFRYAKSDPNPPDSDIPALNAALKKNAQSLRDRVSSLFTLPPTTTPPTTASRIYDEFSNHTVQSTNRLHYYTADSLEGVHDSIHDIFGGNGHMSYPDYAGFDPIFYIHHCNVDRLYALWEYVYPKECYIGKWEDNGAVYPFTQSQGTYALVYNSELLGQTELAPFRRKDEGYWTSDDVRYFVDSKVPKYYTYPVVAGEVDVSKPATASDREKYRKLLQDYYGVDKSFTMLPPKLASFVKPAVQDSDSDTGVQLRDTVRIVIGVQTPESAFNGPYSIEVGYTDRNDHKEHVGTISVFARQPDSNCAACKAKRQLGSTIHGILPVPNNIVQDLVEALGQDVEPAAPEALIDELKSRLSATILDRHKIPVGHAKGSGHQIGWDSPEALEPYVTPVITVASAYVARVGGGRDRDGEPKGPVKWDGWTNHGEVFRPDLGKTGWRSA